MLQVTRNQPALAPMRAMFNNLADGLAGPSATRSLPLDILERDDHYAIVASVPGLTREQVSVELEKGVLSISANAVTDVKDDAGEACGTDGDCCCRIRQERFTGASNRRVRLPVDIDEQSVEASLENGLLTVTLPKPEASGPRRIAIT